MSENWLFELPIRILRMLQIPQWPAATHFGRLLEIVLRWWRGSGPLERPRIPGVITGNLTFPGRP